jgi:hypothetical protein
MASETVNEMRRFAPALWFVGLVSTLSALYFHSVWSSNLDKYAVYIGLSAWCASTFYFLLPLQSVKKMPEHRRLRGFLLTALFALNGLALCTKQIVPSYYFNIIEAFILVGIMWCLVGIKADPKTS